MSPACHRPARRVLSWLVTTSAWPPLPVDEWAPTRDTLQLWTQIVGKVRLARTPLINHWWNVALYVTAPG